MDMHTYIYVYIYIYIHLYIFRYIYIYIYIYTSSQFIQSLSPYSKGVSVSFFPSFLFLTSMVISISQANKCFKKSAHFYGEAMDKVFYYQKIMKNRKKRDLSAFHKFVRCLFLSATCLQIGISEYVKVRMRRR